MTATDTFFSAWSEADDTARLALISGVVTDGCTYDDPRSQGILTGDTAIADYVGNFARMADGTEQMGQYFVEHDSDKITRMVGFVGTGATA
jgi:hypothetical protein